MSVNLKKISAKAISLVLATVITSSTMIQAAAVAQSEQTEYSFENSAFILHTSDERIVLNEDKVDIKGNLFSAKKLEYTGKEENFSVTGNNLDGSNGDKCEIPDYIDLINANAEYDFTIESSNSYSGTFDLSESSLYCYQDVTFNEAVLNGGGNITANGDITMHILSKIPKSQEAVVMSENGDITINSSEFTFNGLLYAPNGKITINSKHVDFCGAVYAKEIEINGTSLVMNYKDYLPDTLVCDAGEDVVTYVEDGAKLSASCNYKNANIVFSVDESQQEFVSITDANTLNPGFEFTQAGEYEITMTATVKNVKAADTVKITVKPEPVAIFTSTEDFTDGKMTSVSGENDELKLAAQSGESNGISAMYNADGGKGISVEFNQSKTELKSVEDNLALDYTFSGYGKAEYSTGNDMILLVDNSGSMSSKLDILKQAALNILEHMGPNDRFGLADLGRVHLNLTNDKEALTKAINRCTSGSGSSDYLTGVDIHTLPMFDQTQKDRNKYIILIADGETPLKLTRYDEERNPYIVTVEDIAQHAYDAGVRVITFQMNDDSIYTNPYGYGMQELAAKTKGFYKQSTDSEEIASYMTQFATEVYNSAGSDVTFTVTVTDKSYLDTANMTAPPTSTVENEDGSVTLSWTYDNIDIDETTAVNLPLKTQLLTGTGYKVIAKDASLTYYNKNGEATVVNLEDVVVGRNDYADSGSWESKVYDSGKTNCTWSLVSWNAEYAGNCATDVYLSVSDDGENFSEPVKVTNNQTLTDLKGRYLKAYVNLRKSEDGATPVLYDLTVFALDGKTPDNTILGSRASINCNGEAYVNAPFTAILDIIGDNSNVKEIKWSVTEAENVKISNSKSLLKYLTFTKAGEYTLTADVVTEDELSAKASVNITVKENPLSDKENSGTDTPTLPGLSINVENLPEVVKYNLESTFTISYNDPSRVAWARVAYNLDGDVTNRRASKIDESGNVTIKAYPYNDPDNITLVIDVFDKYGNSVRETKTVFVDRKKPVITLNSSAYNMYVYNKATITAIATDDYKIASTELTVNGNKVETDENNQYVFTTDVAGTYPVKFVATDMSERTAEKTLNIVVREDANKPYISSLSDKTVVLGNSCELRPYIRDNESGLKLISMTINGEPVELTKLENNYYSYMFTPTETGEYEVVLSTEDNAGNPNVVTRTITCKPDTNRPSVSLKLSNPEVVAGNDITVTVTANDNVKVTELYFYENGVEKTLSEDYTYIHTADDSDLNDKGFKYVEFKAFAKDDAGNESNYATIRLKVLKEDTVKPNPYISGATIINYGATNAYSTMSATDNIAVAEMKLYVNGIETELDQNNRYYFDASDFCTYELRLVAKDTSGNENEVVKIVEIKDTVRPGISLSKDKTKYVIGDSAVFTAKVTDNHKLATVTATFDGKEVELTQTENVYTYTAENLTAGSHRFEVVAKDETGNTANSYTTFTIADTLPPVVEISSDKEKYAVKELPVISYVIEDNVEVTAVEAYLNGEAVEYVDGKLVLPDSWEPGVYTITVKASDKANNTSEDECTFEVLKSTDASDPVITECLINPEYWQVGEVAYITVKATDNSGKFTTTLTANGTELKYDELNSRFEFMPTAEGYVEIIIHVEDESENYTETTLKKYVYASIENHKLVVNTNKVLPLGETATITLSSSDNYPFTNTSVYCDTTGEALAGENNVYTFTTDKTGEYKFTATGTDDEGISDSVEFTIRVASGYEAEINSPEMLVYRETTNETSLTDEMSETVKSFESPVDAYSYVVNTVRYECYINSRRGSVGAYETRNANDVDQSSLLIAFLREMGYPARYVSGNVSLTKEQASSLFATENFDSAWQMLTDSNRNVVMNQSAGVLKMDEVWVEAYVPYSMLGVTDEATKDLGVWVALDPAIKASELSVIKVEEDDTTNEFTQNCQEVFAKYETEEMADLTSELRQIKTSDTISERYIIEQKFDVLPSELQYTVNSEKSRFANLSNDMSDTISVSISDYYGETENLGTYKVSDIHNKRISVQFVGDTGSATIFEMNASQIANNIFRPALTIDGEIVAYGPATTLGNEQMLNVSIKSNNKSESFTDVILAGSMYSIVLDTGAISEQTVNKFLDDAATENPIEGEKKATKTSYYSEAQVGTFLAYAGSEYFRWCDGFTYVSAAQNNVEAATKTKCAVLGYDVDTRENFYGAYTGILPGHFFIDVNINTVYGVSRTGDTKSRNSHMFASTAMSSYFEGFLWEYFLGHNGISTMHIFAYASDAGAQFLPIYKHNYSEQIAKLSFLSNTDISDIRNAVNSGYCVLIPDQEITMNSWSGTGYIVADLKEYNKFVFKISGGLNGGASSEEDALDKVINNGLTYEVFDALGVDCDKFYQNAFSLGQIMYSTLLIRTIYTESKLPLNLTGDLVKFGFKTLLGSDDDRFDNIYTRFANVFSYYVDMLDSILSYADETIDGVREMTSALLHMFCDLTGIEADSIAVGVAALLAVDPSVYEEEETFADKANERAKSFLTDMICKLFGWE